MAVDAQWRLYYNDAWVARHTVEENATLLIHEVGHLLRDHEARRRPPASRIIGAGTLPATARSMTISTPRACRCQAIRRYPPNTDWRVAPLPRFTTSSCRHPVQIDARRLVKAGTPGRTAGRAPTANGDSGSCRQTMRARRDTWCRPLEGRARAARGGPAHRRDLALRWRGLTCVAPVGPRDPRTEGRLPGHDPSCGPQSLARGYAGPVRPHLQAAASTAGVLRRVPHAQLPPAAAAAGFLIDTSSSMEDSQLARALAELAGLTRQLGAAQTSSSRAAMPRSATCGRSLEPGRSNCAAAAARTWMSGCARSSRGRTIRLTCW